MKRAAKEKPATNDAANDRVRDALRHLEDGQNALARSLQCLSPVRGVGDHWRKLSALYSKIQNEWFALDLARKRRAFSLELDSVNAAAAATAKGGAA